MNNSISVIFNKYLIAGLIAAFGLVMISVGLTSEQDAIFTIASINIFIGGVLAILFSSGILGRNIVLAIGIACIAVTVYVGFRTYQSVQATIAHMEARERSESLVRFNLIQIRDIQRAYKSVNNRYAATFDELADFFENGKIQLIESEKTVPPVRLTRDEVKLIYGDNRAVNENMTEREAAILASMGNPTNNPLLIGFKRDTVVKLFKQDFLSSIPRIKERQKLGLGEFNIEKLRYIPMTNPKEEWSIETRVDVPYGGDSIATIRVEGKEPVPIFENAKRQIIGFGNLNTNSDKASWE